MNTPIAILNRDTTESGARIWHQIDVAGRHPSRLGDREFAQVIDGVGLARVASRFREMRNRAGDKWAGILIDADHLSHDTNHPTEAQGWLYDVQVRPDGLYGLIGWTDTGETAVRNGRYKYFSTEYDANDLEWIEGGTAARPTHLVGLALTNRPNNKGGNPLSNRDSSESAPTSSDTNMQAIAEKLGLAPEATEEEINTALDALMSELDQLRAGQAEMQAEEVLNRHADRIPEGQRDAWKKQLLANRESTEALLATLPERAKVLEKPEPPQPLTNRATAQTPDQAKGSERDGEKNAAAIRNRASAIQSAEGITFAAAWDRARAELRA